LTAEATRCQTERKILEYNELIITMRKLPLEPGAKTTAIYASEDFDGQVKSDQSPATVANEAIVPAGLMAALTDTAFVTEEQAASHALWVAKGGADAYPRLGRTMEWDMLVGHTVLAGAGGQVIRSDDHTPMTFGKADFANPFFIAHAPEVEVKIT
jgi:3'-phosphoadenosine 5'-phosphosulfate (PAPS) 3'-phosphatase